MCERHSLFTLTLLNTQCLKTASLYRSNASADWGPLIDVVGFCTFEQASEYKPPEDLVKWLKAGPEPIYAGFGSLVSCQQLKCLLLYSFPNRVL